MRGYLSCVLLALGGCGDKDDVGEIGVGVVDADGDGVYSDLDCDDSDPAVVPGAPEVCNGIDDDCDGLVDDEDSGLDETTATVLWTDDDADGYGFPEGDDRWCALPEGATGEATDCDDRDAAINPGADEVCNGVDDDCDGAVDDADDSLAADATSTWYTDADGDGWGDEDEAVDTCEAPDDTVDRAGDCDDEDDSAYPDATEVWYDGTDQDCDGGSDYDQDGDGEEASAHGGTDCDDTDPERTSEAGCRPEVSCSHPTPITIASNDVAGVTDLAFDGDCRAIIGTSVDGADQVMVMDDSGAYAVITGGDDLSAVALDPADGAVVAGSWGQQAVLREGTDGFEELASSGASEITYGQGPFDNDVMNASPGSIAVDASGCAWVPNWGTEGTLACVASSGATTTWALSEDAFVSVALDGSESVYLTSGDTVFLVDTSGDGALTEVYVASAQILDLVFDYDDDFYVETADDEIVWVAADLSAEAVFATVSGDAKLAIAPDGYLLRVLGRPDSHATYEQYELGN